MLVSDIDEQVNSGPGVPWAKSVRGRLHEVEQIQRAADNLADAARQMRRANVVLPRSIFKAIAGTVAVMAGLAAVAAVVLTYWP